MRFRRSVIVLLVSVIAAITPLAYLDLPDQTWLGGMYDGGDEDDAIFVIQLNLNATQPATPYVVTSSVRCIEPPLPQYETFAPFYISSLDPSRGPPSPSLLDS